MEGIRPHTSGQVLTSSHKNKNFDYEKLYKQLLRGSAYMHVAADTGDSFVAQGSATDLKRSAGRQH